MAVPKVLKPEKNLELSSVPVPIHIRGRYPNAFAACSYRNKAGKLRDFFISPQNASSASRFETALPPIFPS
jgi:hypothetical protein